MLTSFSNLIQEIKIRYREHFGFDWIEIYMYFFDTREKIVLESISLC